MPTIAKLLASLPVERDLNLQILQHPSVLGTEYIELQLVTPSTEVVEEKLLLNRSVLPRLIEELHIVAEYLGPGSSASSTHVPGQEKFEV